MIDEHARFIATGYTETRWQQLLRSRERFRLKMIALRDWSYEHPGSESTQSMPVSEHVIIPKMVITNDPSVKEVDFIDIKTPQDNKSAF
jgi:hypothetical protein